MKNVSAYFVTDGREELLVETLISFHDKVQYPFTEKIIINDCIDEKFKKSVDNLSNFYGLRAIHNEEKKGFAGAYHTAWENIGDVDYVFGSEDDFLFNQEINIFELIYILEYNRNLTQICLKRQAWNEEEKKAGGIIEQWPELYEEKNISDLSWCEHRNFFSTNPSLIPKWVIEKGWPRLPQSESEFSKELFRNPNYKSAYLGKKFDAPLIEHIGKNRAGFNY